MVAPQPPKKEGGVMEKQLTNMWFPSNQSIWMDLVDGQLLDRSCLKPNLKHVCHVGSKLKP